MNQINSLYTKPPLGFHIIIALDKIKINAHTKNIENEHKDMGGIQQVDMFLMDILVYTE